MPRVVIALAVLGLSLGCNDKPREPKPRANHSPSATTNSSVGVAPLVAKEPYPAPHAPLPTLRNDRGKILRHPTIVTVTFEGDDPKLVARFGELGERITTSTWWKTVTEGLCVTEGDCVGSGSSGGQFKLPNDLPKVFQREDLFNRIKAEIAKKTLPVPEVDPIFVVYIGPGMVLMDDQGLCGPNQRRGFHLPLTVHEKEVSIAVVGRCSLDEGELTGTASHEILETATDPSPGNGFILIGGPEATPFLSKGMEIVDPCWIATLDTHRVAMDGFVFHRAWSNKMAKAGKDPCVPHPQGSIYVGLAPKTPTVHLPEGESGIVELDAFSERAVPNWSVSAIDLSEFSASARMVEVELDRTTVNNGTTVHATLRRSASGQGGGTIVGFVSTLGTRSYLWPMQVNF